MSAMSSVFEGPVFVVRDNIDTDQIIPAQYLNLVPTIPEEYEKLNQYLEARKTDEKGAWQQVLWALMTSSEMRFNR